MANISRNRRFLSNGKNTY